MDGVIEIDKGFVVDVNKARSIRECIFQLLLL